MKKYTILISIVVITAVIFIGINIYQLTSQSLSSYTHTSGAFRFEYPSNLFVSEMGSTVLIAENKNSLKPISSISVMYYPGYISKFKESSDMHIENITIDGYKTLEISYPKYPQYGVSYFVILENIENPSSFVMLTMLPNTIGFTQKQFDLILKSFSVNKEKMDSLIEESIKIMKIKGLEAKIKATLASVRPSAELYYNLGNGYINLCNPVSNSQGEKLLKEEYVAINSDAGEGNLICFAKKDSYAISVKMPQGEVWCIDSKGYMGTTSSMVTKYSCK